jgi:hypothetical protein
MSEYDKPGRGVPDPKWWIMFVTEVCIALLVTALFFGALFMRRVQ